MVTVTEAIKSIWEQFPFALTQVSISLEKAVNSYLSESIHAPISLPPFTQSAMDGYAVHLHDKDSYSIVGEIKTGDHPSFVLKPGQGVKIATGAMVPSTANAVIIQENVKVSKTEIQVDGSQKTHQNIRFEGEQIKRGQLAMSAGQYLSPSAIGYLAALGIQKVKVYKKPSIGILVTGTELVTAGEKLPLGKIYESNGQMLGSALRNLGFAFTTAKHIPDHLEKTIDRIQDALSTNEVVIITGGISVGDLDFVGMALNALEVETIFYKVNQKPGRPLYFGKKDRKFVFALPGNPGAALHCFYIYVHPFLKMLSGNPEFEWQQGMAVSESEYLGKTGRMDFLKGFYKDGKVTLLHGQSSSMLKGFVDANAIIIKPENDATIAIGQEVPIIWIPKP